MSHQVPVFLIREQSKAVGIPLITIKTTREKYGEDAETILNNLKSEIEGVIFGYIVQKKHKELAEKKCYQAGLKPIFPLWVQPFQHLLNEFISIGFKARIVNTKIGKEWYGREINHFFIQDMQKAGHTSLCGEAFEYHTFVTDGPIFKEAVKWEK